MKKLFVLVVGVICSTAGSAMAAPTIHCVGNQNGHSVVLEIFPADGYEASYHYVINDFEVSSGGAHGGSFTACSSRAASCNEKTLVQYTVKEKNLILTASHAADTPVGSGELAIYQDESSQTANTRIAVQCSFGVAEIN